MVISYKKLWKLLIDLNMKKKHLQQEAGVSPALIAKLGRNENVVTESLVKICSALRCDIGDIIEIIPVERENDELTKLRDWLLPMLLNGQAKVK